MSITYILLSVSIACNVWFVLLLLADRIADTKAARLLRGIADVWKSLHETSEERPTESPSSVSDNEIIGKSKFKMQPQRPTATTPVPKDSTPEKGVEMSEDDITFESANNDSKQETDSARIPDEKLDEAFTNLSPDELGYSDDEPEEESDRPRASGFSFDEIGEAVHIATKKNPSGKEQQKAREVFAELEDTELYEKLMAGSTEVSIRIKGLMEIRLKKPKKDFVIPDRLEDFNIRDYV
ncbi:conjugal transfer protein TraD [Prevotella copri]|mgnify:FL=1|uniref:Conjugal transfer protein TraD n=1 Tax=Segatella copri TaxID=165179 RepID=A0A646HJP2_9BACT|nr:conjugal transfer protein TraD [Segatella copri]MQN89408.1 conjugal transfer protein TraD [Segatella copri]MQO77518.1 conjugal transfer protein TraD [Segatella copri]